MSEGNEKKSKDSFWKPVFQTVISGVLLLVCTTLYNLFLAHIWPVTIHFGEYSLNNVVFILVSIVSSFILVVVILGLEMYYVLNTVVRGLFTFLTPKDQRGKRKHRWYEYVLDAFLLPAAGVMSLLVWLISLRDRKESSLPAQGEEAQQEFAKRFPFMSNVAADQKNERP